MLNVTQRVESTVTFKGKNNYKLIFECPITEDTYHPLEALLTYIDEKYNKPSTKEFLAAISTIPTNLVDDEYSIVLFTLSKTLKEFKLT